MWITRIPGCAIPLALTALLLNACGEAEPPNTALNRMLGDTSTAAPLAESVADPGILTDQAGYKPTREFKFDEPAQPGQQTGMNEDIPPDAAEAVTKLFAALEEGNISAVLDLYNPDHIAAVHEHVALLTTTFDKLQQMAQQLEQKLDPAIVQKQMAQLSVAPTGDPKTALIDPDHVVVTPNANIMLFGPVQEVQLSMPLVRTGDEWLFELVEPLTDEQAEQTVQFHEMMQHALDRIMDAVAQVETVDEQVLAEIMADVMAEAAIMGAENNEGTGAKPDEGP